MAPIFLNYAREDVDSAKKLAEAVGDAGHDVWWDRHIHGGSRFTTEIDRALKDAEVVMVLRHSEADPDLDPIRDNPRFKNMLSAAKQRLGVAQ